MEMLRTCLEKEPVHLTMCIKIRRRRETPISLEQQHNNVTAEAEVDTNSATADVGMLVAFATGLLVIKVTAAAGLLTQN